MMIKRIHIEVDLGSGPKELNFNLSDVAESNLAKTIAEAFDEAKDAAIRLLQRDAAARRPS